MSETADTGRRAPVEEETDERQLMEVSRTLHSFNIVIASCVSAFIVISAWGHWRALALLAAIQVFALFFNVWSTFWLLPRLKLRAELYRSIVNMSLVLAQGPLVDWALPIWLWGPFIAVALDHSEARFATWLPLGFAIAQGVLGLIDGAPWVYPATFIVFTFFCSRNNQLRYGVIRDMLMTGERQRIRIGQAHASLNDMHERLSVESEARQKTEAELQNAQKLESVGRLASGVAHEINTPVQYVSDSVHFLRDASRDMLKLITTLQAVRAVPVIDAAHEQAVARAIAAEEHADLPYLIENMPKALDRSLDGLGRVATIVRSMKAFSQPDTREMSSVDLNQAIQSTLTIAYHEYKYVADVVTELQPLPPVRCHANDINQVILNIVINAAHAIGDVVGAQKPKGRITIRSWVDADTVAISIDDTGPGIPEHIRHRIFDPFFTTKEVGKGTGQGLAIARAIVTKKHHGRIQVDSQIGKGSTFTIILPIHGAEDSSRTQPTGAAA